MRWARGEEAVCGSRRNETADARRAERSAVGDAMLPIVGSKAAVLVRESSEVCEQEKRGSEPATPPPGCIVMLNRT